MSINPEMFEKQSVFFPPHSMAGSFPRREIQSRFHVPFQWKLILANVEEMLSVQHIFTWKIVLEMMQAVNSKQKSQTKAELSLPLCCTTHNKRNKM